MHIIYCHSCDDIFAKRGRVNDYCPICGAGDMLEVVDSKRGMDLSDRLIKDIWFFFGECEYDGETETILEDFMDFPAGTWREDIWHWFDKAYSKGVHELIYT